LSSIGKDKQSQDYDVVKNIIDSYVKTFHNELPPHPKMSRLSIELIQLASGQRKSLIFVRRVNTAYELEKRLLNQYEREVVVGKLLNLTGSFKRYKTKVVEELLNAYSVKNIREGRDDLFRKLQGTVDVSNFISSRSTEMPSLSSKDILIWFKFAYSSDVVDFKKMADDFIRSNKKNISYDFKQVTVKALDSVFYKFKNLIKGDNVIVKTSEEEQTGYFFINYFKEGEPGYRYRSKMYRENWFDISLLGLNYQFNFVEFSNSELESSKQLSFVKSKKRKHQSYLDEESSNRDYLIENGKLKGVSLLNDIPQNQYIKNASTFLTNFLNRHCKNEICEWINKRLRNNDIKGFIKDLNVLNAILKNIFRNGSGLLPGFISESVSGDYEFNFSKLLIDNESPFNYVLNEIKTIIKDFDLLVSTNFQDYDEVKINTILRNLSPVVGTTGQDKIDRGILASRFRMPGPPYILVTTDIFREGEDLHTYCQNVYHYGIAWNPSDMEQRTGRIDRINSLSYRKLNSKNNLNFDNMVQVFYPYITQSVEVNQVKQLLENINRFILTFNEIEINNDYKSLVEIGNQIEASDIPIQIKQRLLSLYDVDKFKV
jgi:hypothetical protein